MRNRIIARRKQGWYVTSTKINLKNWLRKKIFDDKINKKVRYCEMYANICTYNFFL